MFSSLEYIRIPSQVTKIGEGTFSYCRRLKKIDFFEKSQLKTICKNGWCRGTAKLTEISIVQNNEKNISNYKDSFIIGKSDLTNEYFDVLLIARRDIQKVAIPSFIRKIGQYAFDECKQIQSIKFSSDSKLKSIDNYAFFNSSLESISIPRKVANIGDFAFSFCNQLKSIEYCQNSKLSLIENYAFSDSSLEKIFIPSYVTRIGKYAFSYCRNFRNVDFADSSELEIIDENAFYMSKSGPN
ncbi:hypothetical protein M9Y10_038034 [Tritrichomonas musculus]|uniref:Surface antigen BspA-like n=1 Tax=Tritrichomonas musculus TaxID=1915356 RepID=A0ABR2K7F3_9EUKA